MSPSPITCADCGNPNVDQVNSPCPQCGSTARARALSAKFTSTSSTPAINAQQRYSFVHQFLQGSALFTRRAHQIESYNVDTVNEEMRAEHLACVVSAVTQCAAALEAEIAEILHYGPGYHLGSSGIDIEVRNFLKPLKELKHDALPTLQMYKLVLHLLKKPTIKGHINADADLLIKLRNRLIHYKSHWGPEMDDPNMDEKHLFRRLQRLNLEKPPFVPPYPQTNFFPLICMNASLASWCVKTAVTYIDEFYEKLDIESRLKSYNERLTVPLPRTTDTH